MVFTVNRAKGLIGAQVSCDGWFFRGFSQYLALNSMRSEGAVLNSNQRVLALIGSLVVAATGGIWWVAGDSLSHLFA